MVKNNIYRLVMTIPLDDCTLDEILEKLNSCKQQHPDENLEVEFNGMYMQYSGPDQMNIGYFSEETDEELRCRLDFEREKIETKERKELGRLISAKTLNDANQKRLHELMGKYHNG